MYTDALGYRLRDNTSQIRLMQNDGEDPSTYRAVGNHHPYDLREGMILVAGSSWGLNLTHEEREGSLPPRVAEREMRSHWAIWL